MMYYLINSPNKTIRPVMFLSRMVSSRSAEHQTTQTGRMDDFMKAPDQSLALLDAASWLLNNGVVVQSM